MSYTRTIILYLIFTCGYTTKNYGLQSMLRTTQTIYTKHGQTISNGAIWTVDTIYLLGKLFPQRISERTTTNAFATLNYIGLFALGTLYQKMKESFQTTWRERENDRIKSCAALAQSYCISVALTNTITTAIAATYTARGNTKSALNMYRFMRPFTDGMLAITIILDIYRLTRPTARALGASNLALKGLGYACMAICQHNPNSLLEASCIWSMATLYNAKSLLIGA